MSPRREDPALQAIRQYQFAYSNAPYLDNGIKSLQKAIAHLHSMAGAAEKGWQPVSRGTAMVALELLSSKHNPGGELTKPLAMIVMAHLADTYEKRPRRHAQPIPKRFRRAHSEE